MLTNVKALFGNAYALLIFATAAWGGNAVAGKMAAGGWEPFTLTCVRWLLVTLVLIPMAGKHVWNDRAILKQYWWFLIGICGFFMAMFNLMLYLALNYTTAINVSIEQASMPLFIIFANFIFLSQRVTVLQMLGVVISIGGVLITSTNGEVLKLISNGLNKGDAIMLFGCFFYAVYTFSLRWRPKVHWMTFIFCLSVGAFLTTIPFSIYEFNTVTMSMPAMSDWLVLVYIVIFPSILSQLFFARSVELIGSNRAGLFINLVPLFGSLLAVLIIGEKFQWFHAVGMIMVVSGIMLAEKFAHE